MFNNAARVPHFGPTVTAGGVESTSVDSPGASEKLAIVNCPESCARPSFSVALALTHQLRGRCPRSYQDTNRSDSSRCSQAPQSLPHKKL